MEKTPEQVADKAINLWNAYIAGRITKEQMGAALITYVKGVKTTYS
jgi:hypothetical protein